MIVERERSGITRSLELPCVSWSVKIEIIHEVHEHHRNHLSWAAVAPSLSISLLVDKEEAEKKEAKKVDEKVDEQMDGEVDGF